MPSPVEPRGLRIYVLLTTAFVVVGSAAAFLVWWVSQRPVPAAPVTEGSEAERARVVLRPVDFPPDTSPEVRARVDLLVDQAVFGAADPGRATSADDELASLGAPAAARLVDGFHRASRGEGFRSAANRRRAMALDRILLEASRRLAPAPSVSDARVEDPTPEAVEGLAKAWLAWWDALASRSLGAARPR